MLEKRRYNPNSFFWRTQLDNSMSNMVDQSLPRRLVGQPRRAYSRTALWLNFFSRTSTKKTDEMKSSNCCFSCYFEKLIWDFLLLSLRWMSHRNNIEWYLDKDQHRRLSRRDSQCRDLRTKKISSYDFRKTFRDYWDFN